MVTEPVWTTVEDESPTMVEFDTPGDVFVGVKQGYQHVTFTDDGEEQEFDICLFRIDGDDTLYGIAPGFKLERALSSVPDGTLTRITYKKQIDTGRPSPMKDFKVETAK